VERQSTAVRYVWLVASIVVIDSEATVLTQTGIVTVVSGKLAVSGDRRNAGQTSLLLWHLRHLTARNMPDCLRREPMTVGSRRAEAHAAFFSALPSGVRRRMLALFGTPEPKETERRARQDSKLAFNLFLLRALAVSVASDGGT